MQGTIAGMAMTGPKHYRDAMQLYNEAKRKNNPAEKAALMQEAIFNMLAALVASNVHNGTTDESAIKQWMSYGVYIGDRHGR
jgi:hypothetical protein